MSRLWSNGFELGTTSAGVEWDSLQASTISYSIQSTITNGATFSLKLGLLNSASSYFDAFHQYSTGSGVVFARAYIYVSALPSSTGTIFTLGDGSFEYGAIFMNSSGQLGLGYHVGATFTYGTTLSSAISLNTWYRIELKVDASANNTQIVTALLNGTQIDSQTGSLTASANGLVEIDWGMAIVGTEACTATIYFDDIAVNDNSGSNQNSYPGAGQITHLQPATTGDNNQFTIQHGGTAGAANNFTRVDEVTPDDGTTYNGDTISGHIDDFALTSVPSNIGSLDTINVVAVGVRYRAAVNTLETTIETRIKKTSGGTVSSSTGIKPTSTSWQTNADTAPHVYNLTTYNDPDSNPWTKTTLGTAQIGYTVSTVGTNATDISTVWMLIDSTASASITLSVSDTTTTSESTDQIRNNTRDLPLSDTEGPTTETITLEADEDPNISDTTSHTEAIILLITSYSSVSDTTTTSEVIGRQADEDPNTSDSTTTSENITVDVVTGSAKQIVVSDNTTTSESIILLVTGFISLSDTTTTSESITLNDIAIDSVSDTTVTSESITVTITSLVNVSDTTTTSETKTVFVPILLINISDTTVTSEHITIVSEDELVTVSDTTTTSESIFVSIPASNVDIVHVSDTTITSEQISFGETELISVNDTTVTLEGVSSVTGVIVARSIAFGMTIPAQINFTLIKT